MVSESDNTNLYSLTEAGSLNVGTRDLSWQNGSGSQPINKILNTYLVLDVLSGNTRLEIRTENPV